LRAGEPKYVNSSDSPVFSKGRLLYGLNWARHDIRRENRAILVEGYFDVVRLVAAGAAYVVAPLGTALTEDQGTLLGRYTKEVVLLYDSDAAGLKATFRAGDILLAQGFTVLVASLPPGEDPDSFVAKRGKEGLDSLVDAAMDVFDRKVGLLEQKGWFRDLTNRRRAIDRLLPTIRAAADPLTRDIYATRASEASGVRKEVILGEVDAGGRSRTARPGGASGSGAASVEVRREGTGTTQKSDSRTERRRHVPGEVHERAILAALLQAPGKVEWAAERLGEVDFWVPEHRAIFHFIVAGGGEATVREIERQLSAEEVPFLQAIVEYGESLMDIGRTLEDGLANMERRALGKVRREIDRQMPLASADEKTALLREKERLRVKGGGSWSAVRPQQ
jgi:DNA primase